jgi:hypothetical protein
LAALVFTIIAVCTFMLKGKQWPTMVTTAVAVWYLAGKDFSQAGDAFTQLANSFMSLF